jgi:amidophosphoribosyltransferase
MVIMQRDKVISMKFSESGVELPCAFNWVYMSRPETIFAGRNVYMVRDSIGAELAKMYPLDVDAVVPVPDSGTITATAYSNHTQIPLIHAIVKDRYVSHRSFQKGTQAERRNVSRKKLNINIEPIRGQRILLVDDSTVRGNAMSVVIDSVRSRDQVTGIPQGAVQVDTMFSFPPITHGCRYGLDFRDDTNELVARNFLQESLRGDHDEVSKGVARKIGSDHAYFPTKEGLLKAIGRGESVCTSCITGKYFDMLPAKVGKVKIGV